MAKYDTLLIMLIICYSIIGIVLGAIYHVLTEEDDIITLSFYGRDFRTFGSVLFGLFWPVMVIFLALGLLVLLSLKQGIEKGSLVYPASPDAKWKLGIIEKVNDDVYTVKILVSDDLKMEDTTIRFFDYEVKLKDEELSNSGYLDG